jgi:hypothetical protein
VGYGLVFGLEYNSAGRNAIICRSTGGPRFMPGRALRYDQILILARRKLGIPEQSLASSDARDAHESRREAFTGRAQARY